MGIKIKAPHFIMSSSRNTYMRLLYRWTRENNVFVVGNFQEDKIKNRKQRSKR